MTGFLLPAVRASGQGDGDQVSSAAVMSGTKVWLVRGGRS
jgi:hypothetical protein